MVTAVEILDIAVRQRGPSPHQQLEVLLFSIFVCLECKEVYETYVAHVTPHLYENCVALFSVDLCSCYRICIGAVERGMTECELNLGEMYDDM
jgi:hypothetical protein